MSCERNGQSKRDEHPWNKQKTRSRMLKTYLMSTAENRRMLFAMSLAWGRRLVIIMVMEKDEGRGREEEEWRRNDGASRGLLFGLGGGQDRLEVTKFWKGRQARKPVTAVTLDDAEKKNGNCYRDISRPEGRFLVDHAAR